MVNAGARGSGASVAVAPRRRAVRVLADLGHRATGSFRDRLRRVRAGGVLAVQAGLAAGFSWWVADDLLRIPQPLFAPISAVIALAASVGQRLRRIIEMVVGVSLGVFVGDLFMYVLGNGLWQLGLIVVLAILVAVLISRSPAVIVQAAATAVLVATLSPEVENLEIPRFLAALVGGGVSLVVTAVLLPLNPLRVIDRAATPALDLLVEQLEVTAEALRRRDAPAAQAALDRLRDNKQEMGAFTEAAQAAREASTLSPVHWENRQGPVGRYARAVEPVDRAMRNSGTLIRRTVTLIEDGEPVPDPLPETVAGLANAVRLLRREFTSADEPCKAREQAVRAVAAAGRAYREGVGFSGAVVVAQVRTTASDLIVATGVDQEDANDLIRRAFGALQAD